MSDLGCSTRKTNFEQVPGVDSLPLSEPRLFGKGFFFADVNKQMGINKNHKTEKQQQQYLVSLTRPSHSQEVWYVTVQLIVLADSGCRVYMRSHSTQTTYMFGGKHPTKVVGSGTNRCIVKYIRPFPEKRCGPRD